MTITYCDLCGQALKTGDTGIRILISEYRAESCDSCARQLINIVKSVQWKAEQSATEKFKNLF